KVLRNSTFIFSPEMDSGSAPASGAVFRALAENIGLDLHSGFWFIVPNPSRSPDRQGWAGHHAARSTAGSASGQWRRYASLPSAPIRWRSAHLSLRKRPVQRWRLDHAPALRPAPIPSDWQQL